MTWRTTAIGLIAFLTAAEPAQAQEMPPAIQEIWNLEQAYWRYAQDGDLENYLALWHDDFVGWPCHAEDPVRKDSVGAWVRELREHGQRLGYELQPKAVQRFDDVAVVHYSVELRVADASGVPEEPGAFKITHTWQREGSSWWIIGGMCGRLDVDLASTPLTGQGR